MYKKGLCGGKFPFPETLQTRAYFAISASILPATSMAWAHDLVAERGSGIKMGEFEPIWQFLP
jgi:hypothetical protein